MDSLLRKLKDIDPENKFLDYIINRMLRTDYRGTHKSQHQRYDLDKAIKVLLGIYNLVRDSQLSVPKGDWHSKDKIRMKELKKHYPTYYQLTQNTKLGANSIKKHLFVDLFRAGLIVKYDKNNDMIPDTRERTLYKSVSLTKEAIEMITTKDIASRYRIFTRGVEKLLGDALIDLIQAIDLSEFRRDTFSFEEYTLIFSDSEILDGNEKIELLREYRKLNSQQKERVLMLVKDYCQPQRFKGNKTTKRDYHNWKNETDQLFSLFKTTIYFEVVKIENRKFFKLNTSDDIGVFEPIRSSEPINQYFQKHNVEKIDNFELHHIVPLSYVRNKEEYKVFDDYRNLIYLHKDKHKEIKKDFIVFREKRPRIFFEHRFDNSKHIRAKNNVDASFNEDLLKKMKQYNTDLRKIIST